MDKRLQAIENMKKMNELREEMKLLQEKLDKKEEQLGLIEERRDNAIAKAEKQMQKAEKEYEQDVFRYLCTKIRNQRKSGTVTEGASLENDKGLISLKEQKEKSNADLQKKIKKITEDAKAEAEPLEEEIHSLEITLKSKRRLEQSYFDSTFKSSSSEPSLSQSYVLERYETRANEAREMEEVLKRDREARWEHERKVKLEEKLKSEAEQRRNREAAYRAEKQERERQFRLQAEKERAGLYKCKRCKNESHCTFTARCNSLSCGSFTPK